MGSTCRWDGEGKKWGDLLKNEHLKDRGDARTALRLILEK